MTVSENFVNLVLSLLDNGCGSTDSAKIRRIFEISPADFESIKSRKPRISIYAFAGRNPIKSSGKPLTDAPALQRGQIAFLALPRAVHSPIARPTPSS
jgi:hypothetical protein